MRGKRALSAVLRPAEDPAPAPPSDRSLALERAVSILAGSSATKIPLEGSVGRLVLFFGERGDAVLMLNGLGPAPEGRAYQAWLTPAGSAKAIPVAAFDGSEQFVLLSQPVTVGARVGVTLENVGGATVPSRPARLVAVRVS